MSCLRASPRVCQILLVKSCDLTTPKKYMPRKKTAHLQQFPILDLAKEKNLIHIQNPALFTKQVSLDLKTSLFFLHQEEEKQNCIFILPSAALDAEACTAAGAAAGGLHCTALHCTAHTGTHCSLPQREQHCSLPQPGTRSHADGLDHRARTATGPTMVSGKEKDADAPRMSARALKAGI